MSIKNFLNFVSIVSLIFITFVASSTEAQVGSAKNKSPYPVKYRSLADQNALIKTVTLAPVYDNMNGIYSQPIQKLLLELIQTDKSWGFSEFVGTGTKFIENYDLNPNDVLETLTKSKAQGLLTAFVTKGPRGLNAKLKLFTQDEGLILIEESIDDFNAFEISKLREQFVQMYLNLKNKLPYRGYILSRRGQEVTISVGSLNGIQTGQELALAQILKINRHPKLKVLVGVEKEIIAKVMVVKAEPYLSFAQITFEKEAGVADVGTKVLPVDFISYPKPVIDDQGSVTGDEKVTGLKEYAAVQAEKETSSEKTEPQNEVDEITRERRETLFDRNNSMGSVTAQGVITQYSETQNLQNGASANSSQTFAPGLYLAGRLNVYENIFVQLNYQQTSFSLNNGLAGSTPFTIGMNYSKIGGMLGYNYTFHEDDSEADDDGSSQADSGGLQFVGGIGFAQHKTTADNTSPVAYTSTQTNTMLLHASASMPLNTEAPVRVGGFFEIALAPKFSESPVSSGNSSVNVASFGFFGIYEINDKFNLIGNVNLTNISTQFSGTATRSNPAGSGKIDITTQQLGVEYLF